MSGEWVGYIRITSSDQNAERQLDNVPVDPSYTDTASGKNVQRPQLEALLDFVRIGDTVGATIDGAWHKNRVCQRTFSLY